MPKPSDYTPARRRTMQIVMWGILLATALLAVIVSESSRRANRVDLSPQKYTIGDVTVRLPTHWRVRPRGDDARTVVQASDVGTGEIGRTVTVLCDPLEFPMSPAQYLGTLTRAQSLLSADDDAFTTPVAGQPGLIVTTATAGPRGGEHELYACAILPSLRAIVVRLSGPGGQEYLDVAIVKQIARAIEVANQPAIGHPGQQVTLPEGIEIITPAGFVAVEQKDPNRTDQLLWPAISSSRQRASSLENDWATVELIGCVIPSVTNGRSATLQTMLLLRDPAWRGAKVRSDGEHLWTAEPTTPSRMRACLITQGGLGLLAIIRGGGSGPLEIDAKELASSVTFTKTLDVAQLEDVGATEAARFRRLGFESLIADRDEQWWLWTSAGERPHIGWTHVDLRPNALRGTVETRFRRGPGRLTRLTDQFSHRDQGDKYHSELTRTEIIDDVTRATQTIIDVSGREITTNTQVANGGREESVAGLPPQFIPGALLPLMMTHLRGGPMLLRTESFPGADIVPGGELLTVLISATQPTTRTAEGESGTMRCFTVQVNGSGQISRWYFRQTGELESIEFAGGIQRLPADQNSIRFAFGSDPPMAP